LSAPRDALVFFTDRDLGKRFPEVLAASGLEVRRHGDHFPSDCPDEVWLEAVGRSAWIAVSHDTRIRYKPNEGIAPKRLIATKYVNEDPSSGVVRTRPVCPYPPVARWTGSGSTDDAENFACVEGRRGAYLHAVVIKPTPAK
jgi:hypothetical protein